jgi:hemerythrin-like domain-containing protein
MIELLGTAPTFDDPLGMLRACHRRIERALTALEQVAALEARGTLDADTRAALLQVVHYFATGVPRHAADEEDSLFPRMRAALEGSGSRALAALEALEREHATADAAHQELDALGRQLAKTGSFESSVERLRFGRVIARLQQLYREHIRREDQEVLPLAAAAVEAKALEQVGADMAARRGTDWQQQRQALARLEAGAWRQRPASEPVLRGG